MRAERLSSNKNAAVVLMFGGNPYRRDEIIRLLEPLGDFSIFGAISEEEGLDLLSTLARVDLVLIGGRYLEEQRVRIRNFVHKNRKATLITEPGYDYPYDNLAIATDVLSKLKIKTQGI